MENKVPTDQAIAELQLFVEKYDGKVKKDYEIENDYPQVLEAVEKGLLSFDEDLKPTLRLKDPIKNTEGEVSVSEISFRTRIKPTQLSDIMKGLDIGKNQLEYSLRIHAYLTGQPKAMLDKFSKFDYKVIDQLSTVFM